MNLINPPRVLPHLFLVLSPHQLRTLGCSGRRHGRRLTILLSNQRVLSPGAQVQPTMKRSEDISTAKSSALQRAGSGSTPDNYGLYGLASPSLAAPHHFDIMKEGSFSSQPNEVAAKAPYSLLRFAQSTPSLQRNVFTMDATNI